MNDNSHLASDRRQHQYSRRAVIATFLIKLAGKPANTLAKWIPLAFIAWVSADPVSNAVISFSGKTTQTDVSLSAGLYFGSLDELNKSLIAITILSIIVAINSFRLAKRESTLRKRTVEKLEGRIRFLEQKIDSDRTSSGLTPRGETPEEDE